MAVTIDKAAVKTFENNVRHTSQQMDTALRRWCQEHSGPTASHSFKITGTRELSDVAKTRRQATPVNDQVWSNRVAIAAPYDDGEVVEGEDKAKMIIDPTSAITTSMSYAVKRKYDKIIINAVTANALDEEQNVNAFPAGQYIGLANYTNEISLDLIAQVGELFATNEVPDEEPKVMVVGPKQVRKLQNDIKYTSADYANVKALADGGYVKQWMGFTWIRSNLLPHPAAGQIQCIAMTRKALGLLVLEDLFARVGEDPSLSYATRAYVRVTAGAVRVQDEQVVVLRLADTVTLT